VQSLKEAADKPADRPQLAQPPVEPADAPVVPNAIEVDENNRAGKETPLVVVDSPVPAAPPVQLECSQRTRAPHLN